MRPWKEIKDWTVLSIIQDLIWVFTMQPVDQHMIRPSLHQSRAERNSVWVPNEMSFRRLLSLSFGAQALRTHSISCVKKLVCLYNKLNRLVCAKSFQIVFFYSHGISVFRVRAAGRPTRERAAKTTARRHVIDLTIYKP